jgi:glycosyltransferase involved in cell wall biosynthesis
VTVPLDLTVVMPVYNEEANIETVVSEWVKEFNQLGISFVLLAVNDGSKDGTSTVLQRLSEIYPEVVMPVDKVNAGHGLACRTGYCLAVEKGATWILQIDSDGQCDPHFFPAFWNGRHDVDAVFGMRKTRDDGFLRTLISVICRATTSVLCGMDLKDANVPYRLIRSDFLKEALRKIPDDFDMQNVALTLTLRRNLSVRWRYVPIHFRDRQGGTNSINFMRIARMGGALLLNLYKIGK